MKIYFVRHGQTEHNKTKRLPTGQLDIPLTEKGIEQAKQTMEEISADFSHIYSSDLIRCQQTAEVINQKLNLEIILDPRLRERDFGSLAGKNFDDFDPDGILSKEDYNQRYDYRPYGGEHVEDVKKRLFSFVREIQNNRKDKKILVITSGGIVRLLHYVLHGEVHEDIQNSSIHEFEFPDDF